MKKRYPGGLEFSAAYAARAYFERTGEFRPPRKGEYYLSGAIPQAWQAPNGLGQAYHILKPAPAPARRIVVDGFVYQLTGEQS